MTGITSADYEFIRGLVYEASRINLGPDKHELVSARIGKRLRALGLRHAGEYCEMLRHDEGDELGNLIDAISTNHTYFFREGEHFTFLAQTILPQLAPPAQPRGEFRVWSAASSSGEEPYSIAMLLAEQFGDRPGWAWSVEATDISSRVLARARLGIYPDESVNRLDPTRRRRFFQVGHGPQQGNWRVRRELAQRVTFRQLNLLGPPYPFEKPFDVVFCRNVMIYFDRPTQEELIARLARTVRPGGYLLVGHSESLTGIRHGLKMVKPAIYRTPS